MKVPLPEKKLNRDPNINETPAPNIAMTKGEETTQEQQQPQQQQQQAPLVRLYPDLTEVYRAENLDYNDLERVDNGSRHPMYPDIGNLNITAFHADDEANFNRDVTSGGALGGSIRSESPSSLDRFPPPYNSVFPQGLGDAVHDRTHNSPSSSADLPHPPQPLKHSKEPRSISGVAHDLPNPDGLGLTHVRLEGRSQNALPSDVNSNNSGRNDVLNGCARNDVINSHAPNDVTGVEGQAPSGEGVPRGKVCFRGGLAARRVVMDADGNLCYVQGQGRRLHGGLGGSCEGRSFEEIPADYDLDADYDPDEDYEEWSEASTVVANLATSHLAPKSLADKTIDLHAPVGLGRHGNGNALDAWASWRRHVNKQLVIFSQTRGGNPVRVNPGELRRKELSNNVIRSCVDKSREEDGGGTSLPTKPYIMYGIPRAKLVDQP